MPVLMIGEPVIEPFPFSKYMHELCTTECAGWTKCMAGDHEHAVLNAAWKQHSTTTSPPRTEERLICGPGKVSLVL
jgi:hypothetical protein